MDQLGTHPFGAGLTPTQRWEHREVMRAGIDHEYDEADLTCQEDHALGNLVTGEITQPEEDDGELREHIAVLQRCAQRVWRWRHIVCTQLLAALHLSF